MSSRARCLNSTSSTAFLDINRYFGNEVNGGGQEFFFSGFVRIFEDGVISLLDGESLQFPVPPFPTNESGTTLIAPFAADIDLSLGGSVCIDEAEFPLSDEIRNYTYALFPSLSFPRGGRRPQIITWKDVRSNGSTDPNLTNTFQVVILSSFLSDFQQEDEREQFATFVMINYGEISWITDQRTGSPAQAGFNAGDGVSSFEIPGSGTSDLLSISMANSNTNIRGRYLYRVDQAEIQGFMCSDNGTVGLIPPAGVMLGGTRILILGPCFTEVTDLQIVCKFGNETVPGSLSPNSNTTAECCAPTCLQTGPVNVDVSLDNGTTFPFSSNFIYLSPLDVPPEVIRVEPDAWKNCSSESEYNITWNPASLPSSVDIEVVGYCDSPVPTLVSLLLITNVANTGTYTFMNGCLPSTMPDCELIGGIRVTGTTKSITLWSDFIPLTWIINQTMNSSAWCSDWYENETTSGLSFLDARQPCPCTLRQALRDGGRFEPLPDCNQFSTDPNNCRDRPGVIHCVRARWPNSECGGQECCYKNVTEALTSNEDECDGGLSYRAHHGGTRTPPFKIPGKVPLLSHLVLDEYPRVQCCECSDLCHLYKEVRPPTSCAGYVQITPAACGGDPHIITLDGKSYTYNGYSESVMLEVGDMETVLQARNLPIEGGIASVIKAVGICVANNDNIHVGVAPNGELDVWVKVNSVSSPQWQQVSFSPSTRVEYTGFEVIKGPNAMFPSPGSIQISYTFGMGLYFDGDTGGPGAITVLSTGIEPSVPTRGLLGVWNSDINDDFTPNGGSPIPIDSSTEDIHNLFGLTWEIDETESCLYYGPGESHDFFTDVNFVPSFELPTNDDVSQADIDAVCGNNEFCAFDYLATGDPGFAAKTLNYFQLTDRIRADTMGFSTCPPLFNPTNGVVMIVSALVGGTATYQCFEGFTLSDDVTRICQPDLQWSGSAPCCVSESTACDITPDFSCIVKRPFVGAKVDKDVSIYALPACEFQPSDVCFARAFDTGAGIYLPPSKVSNVPGVDKGKVLTVPLSFPRQGRRFGVFSCVAQVDGCDHDTVDVWAVVTADRKGLIPKDGRVTRTVSIGDDVKLTVTKPNRAPQRTRWMKNCNQMPQWDGRNYVTIYDVSLKDQGIYEVFQRGRRSLNQHTYIILYVRACPKGKFGVSCSSTCTCRNGGLCDEVSGECTCPPGFTGTSCQSAEEVSVCSTVLGRKVSKSCRGLLFCLAGKFGCVCGPGYYGIDCEKKCPYGFYGAGCTERCRRRTHCDPETGE